MKILIFSTICATLWLNIDAHWGRDRGHDSHGHGHAIGIGHGHGIGPGHGHAIGPGHGHTIGIGHGHGNGHAIGLGIGLGHGHANVQANGHVVEHVGKAVLGHLGHKVQIGSHVLGKLHGLFHKGGNENKDWFLQLRQANPRFVEGSPDHQKLISWLNYYFGSAENINKFLQSPQSAELLKIIKGVGGLDKPEDVISLHLLLSRISGRPILNQGSQIQVVQPTSPPPQVVVVQNDYNAWLQSPVGQNLLLKIRQNNPAIASGPGWQQLLLLLRHYFPSTTDLENFMKTPSFNVFVQFLPSLGGDLQTKPQNAETINNYLRQITGRPAAVLQQLLPSQVKVQQPIQVVQPQTQVLVQRPAQVNFQPLTQVVVQPSIKVTAGSPLELWLQTQEGQQFLAAITSVNPSFTSGSSDMVKLLSIIKYYFPTAGDILTLANPTNSPVLLSYVKELGNSFGANPAKLGDLNKYLKSLSTQPLVYFEELGPTESPTSQVIYVSYEGQEPNPGETVQVNGQRIVVG